MRPVVSLPEPTPGEQGAWPSSRSMMCAEPIECQQAMQLLACALSGSVGQQGCGYLRASGTSKRHAARAQQAANRQPPWDQQMHVAPECTTTCKCMQAQHLILQPCPWTGICSQPNQLSIRG